MTTTSITWYCPLIKRVIEEGLCLDINLQREGFFKSDVIDAVYREASLSKAEVASICEACPHFPFRDDENGRVQS
jgi:hypothetical protein